MVLFIWTHLVWLQAEVRARVEGQTRAALAHLDDCEGLHQPLLAVIPLPDAGGVEVVGGAAGVDLDVVDDDVHRELELGFLVVAHGGVLYEEGGSTRVELPVVDEGHLELAHELDCLPVVVGQLLLALLQARVKVLDGLCVVLVLADVLDELHGFLSDFLPDDFEDPIVVL